MLRHHGRKAERLLSPHPGPWDGGFEPGDAAPVSEVMTPAVFCIHAETRAGKVVDRMLAFNVRRLFVVDGAGVLVGVVSAFDVLRGLGGPTRSAG